MKRFVCIVLLVSMLCSLCACVNGDAEYKYDVLDGVTYGFLDLSGMTSFPVRGGSFAMMYREWLWGEDYPIMGDENYYTSYHVTVFDEENKLLYPLCYDPACNHSGEGCFSTKTELLGDPFFVVEDKIISIRPSDVTVSVYSLDGILQNTVALPEELLINKDGSVPDYFFGFSDVLVYNGKVYIDVAGYDAQIQTYYWQMGETCELNRWVVVFDAEKMEFSVLCNYLVPDPYGGHGAAVSFPEITDEYLGVEYDKRVSYCVDLADGSYTERDLMISVDALMESGAVTEGEYLSDVYPVSGIMLIMGGAERKYFSLDTMERVYPSALLLCKLRSNGEFFYNGKLYYRDELFDKENVYCFIRESDEKTFEVSTVFEGGKYRLSNSWPYYKSENGLISRYTDAGIDERDNVYTVTNGTKEIIYQRAHKYVYVTYKDILDGQIDEPWYFDPETGLFETRDP